MSIDLQSQVRDAYLALDDTQAPLTVEEIIHRAGPVRPLPLEEPQAAGRNWWIPVLVAAGAAVITFLVLVPVLFLNAEQDEAPATTPSIVTSTTLESSPSTTPNQPPDGAPTDPTPTTMSPLVSVIGESGFDIYEFAVESFGSSHLWNSVRVPPLEATLPDGSLFDLESFTRDAGDTVVLVWSGEVDGMRLVADEITIRHLEKFQEVAGSASGLTHGFVSLQVTDATAAEAGDVWDAAGYAELPLATMPVPPWGLEAQSLPAWVRLDAEAQVLGGFVGRVEREGTMVDLVRIPVGELLGDRVGGSMTRATRLPIGVQYVTPSNPSIGLISVEDFWYATSISCSEELRFVSLRYFEVPTADVQIGPLRAHVVLRDVAGLYAAAMGGAQVVESVVGEWPALRVEGTLASVLPQMPGVRMGPEIQAGATSLVFYVADTGMGALYVLVSAESTDIAAFAERAQPLINSLTIESDAPWGVCN